MARGDDPIADVPCSLIRILTAAAQLTNVCYFLALVSQEKRAESAPTNKVV